MTLDRDPLYVEEPEPVTTYESVDEMFERLFGPPTAAQLRNRDRHRRAWAFEREVYRLCPWMRWPVFSLVVSFWTGLFDEGIVGTCKPRWGRLTFAYLNDGIRPTLFHAVWSVLHRDAMIYPQGAPRNRSEL